MKIAFITTQTTKGSTVIGRTFPLAVELAQSHEVHVLVHGSKDTKKDGVSIHGVGKDPFTRKPDGKKRLGGIALIARMKWNAWRMLLELLHLQPDAVVVVKPLPENVAATMLFTALTLGKKRIVLDADDFELTANELTSIWQRAAVHWSERMAAGLSKSIIVATPFLEDHFKQLAPTKKVILVPTGVSSANEMAANQSTKTILYLGSVSIASGHRVDLLPNILKKVLEVIPDAKLLIAGSGDNLATLQKTFSKEKLSNNIEFSGRFTSKDLPSIIEKASVFVDPVDDSVTTRAKSSYRVALAGALGLPVVTSNIGIRPMLTHPSLHDRSFATAGDSSDYADKLIAALQHPLSEEDQMNAKEHSKQFSWSVLANIYEGAL